MNEHGRPEGFIGPWRCDLEWHAAGSCATTGVWLPPMAGTVQVTTAWNRAAQSHQTQKDGK